MIYCKKNTKNFKSNATDYLTKFVKKNTNATIYQISVNIIRKRMKKLWNGMKNLKKNSTNKNKKKLICKNNMSV